MIVLVLTTLVVPVLALDQGDGWKVGVIVGTTVGALVFALILLFFLYYVFMKKYISGNDQPRHQIKSPLYQLDPVAIPNIDKYSSYNRQAQIPPVYSVPPPPRVEEYQRSSVTIAGPAANGSMGVLDTYDREPGSHNHSLTTNSTYSNQAQQQNVLNTYSSQPPTAYSYGRVSAYREVTQLNTDQHRLSANSYIGSSV